MLISFQAPNTKHNVKFAALNICSPKQQLDNVGFHSVASNLDMQVNVFHKLRLLLLYKFPSTIEKLTVRSIVPFHSKHFKGKYSTKKSAPEYQRTVRRKFTLNKFVIQSNDVAIFKLMAKQWALCLDYFLKDWKWPKWIFLTEIDNEQWKWKQQWNLLLRYIKCYEMKYWTAGWRWKIEWRTKMNSISKHMNLNHNKFCYQPKKPIMNVIPYCLWLFQPHSSK